MKRSKKIFILVLMAAIYLNSGTVFANTNMAPNYDIRIEYEKGTFGSPTTSDVPPDFSHIDNIRRDKNSSYFPPSYGVFSGEFATEPTSKYHEQDRDSASVTSYNNVQYYNDDVSQGYYAPTSTMMTTAETELVQSQGSGGFDVTYSNQNNYKPQDYYITTVDKKSDGSIGRISIKELDLDVKVYEHVDNETMKKGVGHFTTTSQWSGNVGLASHNRGNASYFKGIWNLEYGDKIIYTTSAGTRTYAVYSKEKIDEYDTSILGSTQQNQLTLITCVEGKPALRWCIVAREVL